MNFTRYSRFPKEIKSMKHTTAKMGFTASHFHPNKTQKGQAKRVTSYGFDFKDIIQSCKAEPNSIDRITHRANIFAKKKSEDDARRTAAQQKK